MVYLPKAVLSALAFNLGFPPPQEPLPTSNEAPVPSKSIAVVGAGSAGVAMLYTLLEFPLEVRKDWEIVLFEQARDVGGVWLHEIHKPDPPTIPITPLYPHLRTNTPVPSMTYPNFPFPPKTPLFPPYTHIQAYHSNYTRTFGLDKHIAFNHTVLAATWAGNSTVGQWNVTVRDSANETKLRHFDHLVVATGNNHYPRIVNFKDQEKWLSHSPTYGPEREILHSVWYKGPERYAGRGVLVVGNGASGIDAASQVAKTARKVYQSIRSEGGFRAPDDLGIVIKPAISHFTNDAIVFTDGSVVRDVDAVILGTGYELRVPFLEAGSTIAVDPSAHTKDSRKGSLTTNTRYIFPLHRHIASLCPSHPPNALTFIGLPVLVANCPADRAQSIYAANIIRDPSLLPSREEALKLLDEHEDDLRGWGWDPYVIGHRMVNGTAFEYQDGLVQDLRDRGAIEDDGRPFVESWRRRTGRSLPFLLKRGWLRVEELGQADKWLRGVETEEQWVDLMDRLYDWEEQKEKDEGVTYPGEIDSSHAYWDDFY